MRAEIRDPESVSVLRPLEVASYLRASGWAQAEAHEGRYAIWTMGEDYEVLLPLRHDVRDYALRMGDLLGLLSKVEDRSQLSILADLLVTGADVVRVRIADDDLADGSMPIEEHTRTAQKTRDLFMAAACSAIERKAVWHRRKPDQAVNYLRNVRIGQTERGSYVLTVISKVPPRLTTGQAAMEFIEEDQPYERKVTTHLALSLAAAERAAEAAAATGSLDSFNQAVADGVSANLCEALVGLATDTDTNREIDFSFSWSRNRPAINQAVSRIVIAHDRVPYLQEAARQLRESAPVDGFEIEGPVVKLERPEGAATGFATVIGLVEDSARRVRIELQDEDYTKAIRAHENENDIQCAGRLVREGRGYVLKNPTVFSEIAGQG